MKYIKLSFLVFLLLFLFALTSVFAEENVILKSVVQNPSKTLAQEVPFKVFFPKEITPSNVIDDAGCEIAFDYQAGKYFAYSKFLLQPGEKREIKIILEDIWKIPEEEIGKYREKAEDIMEEMHGQEGTIEFFKTERYKNNIDDALNQIDRLKRNKSLSPAEYMEQYRKVMELLASLQTQLEAQEKIKEEVKNEKPKIKSKFAWEVIITILLSLTILGSIFFYLVYTKMKDPDKTDENITIQTVVKPPEIQKKVSKTEKKVNINDIESMLNG